jgi:hypothetical protein
LLDAGNVTVLGNTIRGNDASQASTGWGGGAYLNNVYGAVVRDNTFQANRGGATDGWGGGLNIGQSHGVWLQGNRFLDNAASSGAVGQGGGLVLDYVDVTLENNFFQGNSAYQGGGVYVTNWAAYEPLATWVNSVITDNRATAGGSGSGLYVTTSDGDVHNHLLHTTLARNAGGDGSGVYVEKGTVALTNTLVYSQEVGVQNVGGLVSTVQTLWDSVPTPTLGTVAESGSFLGLAALAADGYHLTEASQAKNAGIDAGIPQDIDGEPRPMLRLPDLGADEYAYRRYFLPAIVR